MMLSPSCYKERYKKLSLVELIDERNKLIKNLNDYEDNYIKSKNGCDLQVMICPSPETRYYWQNEYLKEITNLILDKLKDQKIKK